MVNAAFPIDRFGRASASASDGKQPKAGIEYVGCNVSNAAGIGRCPLVGRCFRWAIESSARWLNRTSVPTGHCDAVDAAYLPASLWIFCARLSNTSASRSHSVTPYLLCDCLCSAWGANIGGASTNSKSSPELKSKAAGRWTSMFRSFSADPISRARPPHSFRRFPSSTEAAVALTSANLEPNDFCE